MYFTKAILPRYFENQCRKESDPTYNDNEIEWQISRLTENRLKIPIQSRYMSDPTFSDIDFKIEMGRVWINLGMHQKPEKS